MIRRLLLFLLLLVPISAHAQISYYTDRTLVPTTLSGLPQPVAAPIPYAPIRVCNLPLTQVQPCLPLATITDQNGVSISNSIGSNFGQFNADVTGRFTFGCVASQNMQIQYAGASNVPAASYPVTCPAAGGTPNILPGNNTWTGTNLFNGTTTFGNTVTVNNPLIVNAASTFSGAMVTVCKQLNPSYLCADQFSGTDASAKIQAAIAALPANGGVVDARNLSDVGGTGSTIIDPGAKSVTLYLGPYTYTIQQVVLETNFHIFGSNGSFSASDTATTNLLSCSTCASTNAMVLGTNGGNGGPIQRVLIDGINLYGATSDTAIGMNLKTVNGAGTGLWYSTFRNMCVGSCGPNAPSSNGFSGGAIVLDGTAANVVNQFNDFYNVDAFKTTGGSPAMSIIGTNGQITFTQCEFDGPTRNDGQTVLNLSNTSGNGGPYSITFNGSTVQHGTTGVNIAGASSITFINTHFETVGQAILINVGVGGVASSAITFIGSTCQNFCGNNSGTGFWAKNLSPNTGTSARFFVNEIQQTVDASYVGFTNLQGFASIGDEEINNAFTAITPLANVGMNIPIQTAFTTTAVASESVTVTGANVNSHCWAEATNATAAALTGVFLSAPTTNAVTFNHSATSGGTFNVFCTPN